MAQKLSLGPVALDQVTSEFSYYMAKFALYEGQPTRSTAAHPSYMDHVNELGWSTQMSTDWVGQLRCQRRQHYTQGRYDVNTTGLVNSDVNTRCCSIYERQPEIPVLLIKPEQHPDSTSITDYLESSSNTAIHQKKNFVTVH
ncbi:vinorine synthase-like [Dorcoceras hygrometricum]|uniref:Vinorine synthase-like n=1 Tax=Dorcoceras hygrometricum TaxID=472368 RepID=A0A2Z7B619_9LAMI|nr:vinorine synthase-like [Dorcoceras hygrometricum]